ncbi:MAG: hypothetical protein Q8K37_04460 [Alphaproteobacteria bacterium]|nr:hypothetical protein [Alphaproteobacteria bacterium]
MTLLNILPCSSSMYFVMDPESAFEASLQGVQENEGVWASF